MIVIQKYPIAASPGTQTISLPRGARVLTAQSQGAQLMLWAMVDSNVPAETRTVCILGTGDMVPNQPLEYVGTVQEQGGFYVWHVLVSPVGPWP